jgi:hypothetical protein
MYRFAGNRFQAVTEEEAKILSTLMYRLPNQIEKILPLLSGWLQNHGRCY